MHCIARMRLMRLALFLALASGTAFAGSKVPLRVVRVMPDTHQALLYDKTQGTHVLVDLGKSIDGYVVTDIDEDEVTLTTDSGSEVVLAAPDWHRHETPAKDAAKPAAAAPQDPYAADAPQDPYAVHVVEAPTATPVTAPAPTNVATVSAAAPAAAPTPTNVPTVSAAAPAAAPTPTNVPTVSAAAPTTPTAAPTTPAVATAAPAPTATPAPPADPVLARADVTAALSNFGKLAASIKGELTPDGAKLDAIAPDSLFAKAGLHAGDVIASVDGQPLHSLDDAASLYARAASLKSLTLAVIRAGKPLTLRVTIQ